MTSQTDNENEAGRSLPQRTEKLLIAGGLLGALAAASCCVVLRRAARLVWLGISGAWIGNLTQLAPYQPYFIAGTAACLGAGY